MKKILLSLGTLVVVGAVVAGATIAFYNDTETSTGNIFTAGSIDLKVDHTKSTYNGNECISNCVENLGTNLIQNGSFEVPEVTNPAKWKFSQMVHQGLHGLLNGRGAQLATTAALGQIQL
jgi:predicted ribosomally synthesized peptide with SipW-like signal peptide